MKYPHFQQIKPVQRHPISAALILLQLYRADLKRFNQL